MPSMPAACIRSAASAYLATMRSMSQSSASFGMARWAGSRSGEGATTGSQSSCAQPVRRPRWVSWIMHAAPCSWTSSVIRRSQGTISSRYACRLPNAGGLSSATTAEPAVIVMPMPPLAFSTWYSRYRSVGHTVLGVGRLVRRREHPVAQGESLQRERLQQRIVGQRLSHVVPATSKP